MKIEIEVIDHNDQRYETCGDWWRDENGTLQVRVSRMSDPRYSRLIAIHELVEVLLELTKRDPNWGANALQGLVAETDAFDRDYEAKRAKDDNESEPGCETNCPVYQGHMVASATENLAAMVLGVNYNSYADEVASMWQSVV